MTPEQITQKVNEYKSQIANFENQMNSLVADRSQYSEGTEEYDNLTSEIDKLDINIQSVKLTIGI
jgi:chaperonin cofactor prefoldin